uniref:GNAT family N-acetyltransferase n=1 Tax=Salmonella sp. SAL4443 TaxID=3159898 RepID=UPI00397A1718
ETYRGKGLSKWLMEIIMGHPDLQGLRRFLLATRDAHGLYRQFGFTPLESAQNMMQVHDPGVYKRNG